jgi:hypothetical protein
MQRDLDFNDTLMHVSGNILKLDVSEQVKPYVEVSYIVPGQLADDGERGTGNPDRWTEQELPGEVGNDNQGGTP